MANAGAQLKRIEIPYFEGVNSFVSGNLSKKQEPYAVENARGDEIGIIEKRDGTALVEDDLTPKVDNYAVMYFENDENDGLYKISNDGYLGPNHGIQIYYLDGGEWVKTGDLEDYAFGDIPKGINWEIDHTIADGKMFIVNGYDENLYVDETGDTIVEADDTAITNHLYGSPIARRINYFKNRLYVADYEYEDGRHKNGVARSSEQLGVVSLVASDHALASSWIEVTDTKYIREADSLDVYRGEEYLCTLTTDQKEGDRIHISAYPWLTVALKASDELWVADTYGQRKKFFRWTDRLGGGEDVKEYDSFTLSGGQNQAITMLENIGDVMMIANDTNIAVWNDYALKNLDLGIGCCSQSGYVKTSGMLWFLDYKGLYATGGSTPTLMSSKVEKYFRGATREGLQNAALGKQRYSVFAARGDVTLYNPDGSVRKVLSDVCMEYNWRQQNWYVHTNIPAKYFRSFMDSTKVDRVVFASKGTGKPILEFLTGSTDFDYVDGEATTRDILFEVESGNITLSPLFERICYPKEVIVETERGNSIECFVSLDNRPFYRIRGNVLKGCVILTVAKQTDSEDDDGRCRRIRLSIRDYSNRKCKIGRAAITFMETIEEEKVRPDSFD